jgi:glucan 1,3-beta-glucosidase
VLILKSGAVEMLSDTATDAIIYAANNTQSIGHPFWSILGAYLDDCSIEITSCDDDDETAGCDTEPDCDVTFSFDAMDALAAAAGSFPDICTDYYALGVLCSLLDAAFANYSAANAGYDSVFGDYVDYTKEMVPSALIAFMADGTSSNPSGGAGNN